ncbi:MULTISPECIES: hypothetical protein [unclassified Spirosoma]|uniref:hypothetical protein n=1 Tax=unclassified Spirosoma TaxID=2621999 RepID=UPI000966DC99|nr:MULTISPECIES: hypothetical protein [unclassified Spirosoma]MBN8823220.1 hypothetical protein [Spirosoma sp.]OJW72631.1 MAG: hypothetical protein BGO59_16060 [Spirosoma sp. 48-14]
MNNRGRFQAQGQHLEESESWAQEEPLYSDQAKSKLLNLKEKLSSPERKKREKAFTQCQVAITRACENGGILVDGNRPYIKSYPGNDKERVDVEVWKGKAFLRRNDDATC